MRGFSTTSALIVAASIIAMAALALFMVLRVVGCGVSVGAPERGGQPAGGGGAASVSTSERSGVGQPTVSASVSTSEQDGVVTAMIQVRRGSLTGVAIKYIMPDGTIWWAKPAYCLTADNTASATTTGAHFSEPVPTGRTVRCAFY